MTMMRGVYVCSLVGIACMTLAAAGQSNSQSSAPYKVPKTSFGQPDLEGVWSNNSATPLQRPAAWADKEFLTDAEVARVQQAARQLEQDGDALFGDELIVDTLQGHTESKSHDTETGNYNAFWLPSRDFERRTSLIIDPPNGRIPPETPEAQKRRAAVAEQRRLHPADGPENRGLSERCITFGVPRFQAAYSSVYQIVQSPTACRLQHGDHPRCASHSGRWTPASLGPDSAVAGQLAWALGRRHAGGGDERLLVQEQLPGIVDRPCAWWSASPASGGTRFNTTRR